MHTFIINATLLTPCHSDMFQLSTGHLQGERYIATSRSTKWVTRCKIQLSEQQVNMLCLVTYYTLLSVYQFVGKQIKVW